MAVTSRTYYEPAFKVKVLDHVRDLGSVSAAAKRNGLEPGIVYSWKSNENGIRKVARKDAAQVPAKKTAPPLVEPSTGIVKRPAMADEHHPEGPAVTVHALGPWLESVVRRELPAAMDGKLEALVAQKFSELESRLTELVRAEFRAFVSKGVGS